MTTKLNLAYGEFYQTLPFPTYGDMLMTDKNRYLENSHARHIVLGIEHILDEGLKGSIEAYYKEYDHIPIDETFLNFVSLRLILFKNSKPYGKSKPKLRPWSSDN